MSSGERIPLAKADEIAGAVVALVADCCQWIEVCGSVRRRKATVGDIEIVAVPADRQHLLARLDRLVLEGKIKKARYGATVQERWGDTYRGFEFQDVRFEIFLADKDNRGYIQWLRTGPGDANQFIMWRMQAGSWPIRFMDGYAWHVQYYADQTSLLSRRRLSVPDEDVLFRLLMMPRTVAPIDRSEKLYHALLDKKVRVPMSIAEIQALYAVEAAAPPVQGRMF